MKSIIVLMLGVMVVLLGSISYAVMENIGVIERVTARLEGREGDMDRVLVRVVIRGGPADTGYAGDPLGCGPYTISLFGDIPAENPVMARGGSLSSPTATRTHNLRVRVRPSTTTIKGHVVWGPDAQIPIEAQIIRLRPAPRELKPMIPSPPGK